MNDDGQLNLDDLDKYLATGKVKLVTFSLMSNVLGTITDAEKIISKCKAANFNIAYRFSKAMACEIWTSVFPSCILLARPHGTLAFAPESQISESYLHCVFEDPFR